MTLPALLRKMTTTSAQAFENHAAAVAKKFARHNEILTGATDYHEEYVALAAEFMASPSKIVFEKLVLVRLRQTIGASEAASFRVELNAAQDAELEKGRGLLAAAIAEALVGVQERRSQMLAEDEARSEQLGVPVKSAAVFARLDRMEEQLDQARQLVSYRFKDALSAYRTAVSAWQPKPRIENVQPPAPKVAYDYSRYYRVKTLERPAAK